MGSSLLPAHIDKKIFYNIKYRHGNRHGGTVIGELLHQLLANIGDQQNSCCQDAQSHEAAEQCDGCIVAGVSAVRRSRNGDIEGTCLGSGVADNHGDLTGLGRQFDFNNAVDSFVLLAVDDDICALTLDGDGLTCQSFVQLVVLFFVGFHLGFFLHGVLVSGDLDGLLLGAKSCFVAALFALAKAEGVPCAEIRAISNYVGEERKDWKIDLALERLTETILELEME